MAVGSPDGIVRLESEHPPAGLTIACHNDPGGRHGCAERKERRVDQKPSPAAKPREIVLTGPGKRIVFAARVLDTIRQGRTQLEASASRPAGGPGKPTAE